MTASIAVVGGAAEDLYAGGTYVERVLDRTRAADPILGREMGRVDSSSLVG